MALYKRPGSKYYWMKFTFDGELIQKSTQVSSKKDAQTVESAYRTQLALGKIGIEPLKKAPTFEKAMNDFLEWSKVKYTSQPGTYNRYYFAGNALTEFFGKTLVNKIDEKQIENFIVNRSTQNSKNTGKPITRETINLELVVLKMLFKRLLTSKVIRENPAALIKKLPGNDRTFHVISANEEKIYLMACPPSLKDVAILMIETGMRCNEVYQLRRENIFLSQNFLKVVEGKTKSSIRQVHLSEKAKKVLQDRLDKFTGAFLFPQNDIDENKATRTLHEKHLEVTTKLSFKFRLYDCRHTFATRAVENGVDLLTLASILGHSSLAMVMRYAHPSENQKAEAIKRMEKSKANRKAKAV